MEKLVFKAYSYNYLSVHLKYTDMPKQWLFEHNILACEKYVVRDNRGPR